MKSPVLKDVFPLYAGVSHSFVNVVGIAVFVVRDVPGGIKQTRNDYIPLGLLCKFKEARSMSCGTKLLISGLFPRFLTT
jgi:hypothetical protein